MKKIILSFAAFFLPLIVFLSVNTSAAEPVIFGGCGDGLSWLLYDDGALVIDGEGEMWDWSYLSPVPWEPYLDSIRTVTVKEGVLSVGSEAFRRCTNLTSVSLSDSVASIGAWAFGGCEGLTQVTLPSALTVLDTAVFCGCAELKNVALTLLIYVGIAGALLPI